MATLIDHPAVRRVWRLAPEPLRRAVRARRARAGRAEPDGRGSLPVELTDLGSRRAIPLPDGWTRDDIMAMLSSLSIEGAPPAELAAYVQQDFERFLHTWGLAREADGRALEIGANPYFTTLLLSEFTGLDLTLTNSFDPSSTGLHEQRVTYRRPHDQASVERIFTYESLNVEAREFPFSDATFDVVLFCEVIEHLLNDPLRAIREIKRVLRRGGTLIVTTPNVARLENVARVAAGANIYDPYSGYGPYGRHNREYTRHEIVKLLQFAGFEVVDHFTADVHPHAADAFVEPHRLVPLVAGRLNDLGQYLFCKAINTAPARPGWPEELFRSRPTADLVNWD